MEERIEETDDNSRIIAEIFAEEIKRARKKVYNRITAQELLDDIQRELDR